MIAAAEAIRVGRALLGTPYGSEPGQLDCINYIKRIIRTAQGGVPGYTTAGTNALWGSYSMAAKYRDLTWRQEDIAGARAGMLAFKRSGSDVHHVGLCTGAGTVLHSSSAKGCVVETDLANGQWELLAIHRYIAVSDRADTGEEDKPVLYQATVNTDKDPLRVRDAPGTGSAKIGSVPRGAVVDILADDTPGWPLIQYGSLRGYASSQYLLRGVVPENPEVHPPDDTGDAITIPRDAAAALYNALSEIQQIIGASLGVD